MMKNVHIDTGRPDQDNRSYHYRVAQLAAKHTPQSGTVVDIGSGLGNTLAILSAARPELHLIGMDSDEACLARTARVSGAEVRLIDLNTGLPQDALARASMVLVSHVLEHTVRPLDFLNELTDTVRIGTKVILAVPNPTRPDVFLGNLKRRHYVNRGHLYAWDPSHWRNFLESFAPLDVIEYSFDAANVFPGDVPFRPRSLRGRIETAVGRRLPWLGFSNIAVCVRSV